MWMKKFNASYSFLTKKTIYSQQWPRGNKLWNNEVSSKSYKDAGRRNKGVKTRVIFISPKEKLSKKHSKETGNFNTFVVNGTLVF